MASSPFHDKGHGYPKRGRASPPYIAVSWSGTSSEFLVLIVLSLPRLLFILIFLKKIALKKLGVGKVRRAFMSPNICPPPAPLASQVPVWVTYGWWVTALTFFLHGPALCSQGLGRIKHLSHLVARGTKRKRAQRTE